MEGLRALHYWGDLVPGESHDRAAQRGRTFQEQGPCTIGTGGLGECNLLATVQATFDTTTGTITIPVPLEVIKAKPGSKIGPGTNAVFGGTIYSSPAAVTANVNSPHDTMIATETFVVPKKGK